MQKILVTLGVILVFIGLGWPLRAYIRVGQLPGEVMIRKEYFTFYFPLTTGLLVRLI